MSRALRRIVIVGGGIAGWMSAATLAGALAADRYAISLVELDGPDDSLGPFGDVETTNPGFRDFLAQQGIGEGRLIDATRGSFSLGVALTGWARVGQSAFMPFGDTGAPIGSVDFHHLASRLRAAGNQVRLADYSLAAIAAGAERFAPPSDDPRSPLSAYEYGLHLDRDALTALLRDRSQASVHAGHFTGAELAEDGSIAAVITDRGERIEGDLFLDCSGPSARLIGEALGTGFHSWSQWMPCDRAIATTVDDPMPPLPFAHDAAHEAGWRRSVPIQGHRGETVIFSSARLSDGEALEALGRAGRIVPFEAGHRTRFWNRNCIAVGAAAGLLEPLHATSLHFVQTALRRLIALFPHDPAGGAEAAEYNRLTLSEMERARDFLILHYKANGRVGEPFWDACRAMTVPDPLAHKIALYESRGRVVMYDDEMFQKADWVTLFDVQGIRPRRHDPLADALPREQLQHHLARLREVIVRAVQTLPSHADYLRRAAGGSTR